MDYSYEIIFVNDSPSEIKTNEALKKINWTGNIREFRNVMERMVILCDKTITAKDVDAYAFTLR